ncbi:unnamed protein product [Ostreobium quekettii]|uniref:Ion transport domain-containing protein n=1 Tax=Ostreobium quekettii TaxID=121088 RepID=A0A8S1J4R6_9CHLO|nr:unnamed protein product [Ostreobium quekettii]
MGLLERLNVAIEDARAIILSPGNGWDWLSTTYRHINAGGAVEDGKTDGSSERPKIASSVLSLYDDFQIINGMPVFVLGNPEPPSTDPNLITHRPSAEVKEGFDFPKKLLQSPFSITQCVFSEDGTHLVTGNAGGGVRVWDTEHGKLIARTYGYHRSAVAAATFRGGRNSVLTCDRSGRLAEWDVSSGKPPKVHDVGGDWELGLFDEDGVTPLFSPGGELLAIALPTVAETFFVLADELKKWNPELAAARSTTQHTGSIVRAGFLEVFDTVQVCDGSTAGLKLQIAWKHNQIYENAGLQWSPDGKRLLCGFISSYSHGFVVLWPDIKVAAHRSFSLWGSSGAFSSDGNLLITWDPVVETQYSNSHKHECKVWDISKLRSLPGNECWPEQHAVHPRFHVPRDGVPGIDGPLTLRHEPGERVLWSNFLWECKSCQAATCVMTSGVNKTLKVTIWDVPTQTPIHVLDAGKNRLGLDRNMHLVQWAKDLISGASTIAVSKGGKNRVALYMATKNEGYIWDAVYGVVALKFQLPEDVDAGGTPSFRLNFSQDGRKFLMCGGDKVLVWNICDPEEGSNADLVETNIQTSNTLVDGMFSSDGNKIGVLQEDRETIFIWDCCASALHEVSVAQEDSSSIRSRRFSRFNFSEDGERVVACVQEGDIFLWVMGSQVSFCNLKKREREDSMPQLAPVVSCRRYARVGAMYSNPSRATSEDPCHAICFSQDEHGQDVVVAFREDSVLKWYGTRSGGQDKVIFRVRGEPGTTCVFSHRGTRALLFDGSTATRVHVWDLVHRQKLRTMEYQINLNSTHGFPTNVSPDGNFAVVGMNVAEGAFSSVVCYPNTPLQDMEINYAAMNTLVSENGNWIVSDEPVEASNVVGDQPPARFPSMGTITRNRVWVSSVAAGQRPKRLLGNYLSPENFLLASHDGRKVACASAKNKIMIWTAEAVEGGLPDYHMLKIMNPSTDPATMNNNLKMLLDQFGPALFNYPTLDGLSIFLAAIMDENAEMVKTMIEWALTEKVKVSLFTLEANRHRKTNGLQIAIDKRSPELTRALLEALLAGLTTQTVLTAVFEESLLNLGKVYPALLTEVISDERMLQMIGETHSAEDAFGETFFLTGTSDKYWPATHTLGDLWEELKPETKTTGGVQLTADAKVIPYPDIAQIGMDGILRPLLLEGMPKKIFSSKTMMSVIDYKWKTYARELMLEEIVHYVFMLLFFTAYTIAVGLRKQEFDDAHDAVKGDRGVQSLVFLILTTILAAMNFVREIKQILTYLKEFPKTRYEGMRVWVSSKWNVMELMSYIFLVLVIPVLHFTATGKLNQLQSVAVGMATILVWWKVLYYFLAFRPTGPLVIMIFEIVRDIVFFLIVSLGLLFGFGMAFFVLFRHDVLDAEEKRMNSMDSMGGGEDDNFYLTHFRTVDRSMFAVFGMMLGDFDLPAFYEAELAPWALTLFVLYMVSMMIILLNLLIAIMSDTFDRVKDVEDIAFLHARASVIDDAESMLSEGKKNQLR